MFELGERTIANAAALIPIRLLYLLEAIKLAAYKNRHMLLGHIGSPLLSVPEARYVAVAKADRFQHRF
jgi:hypothetical protein